MTGSGWKMKKLFRPARYTINLSLYPPHPHSAVRTQYLTSLHIQVDRFRPHTRNQKDTQFIMKSRWLNCLSIMHGLLPTFLVRVLKAPAFENNLNKFISTYDDISQTSFYPLFCVFYFITLTIVCTYL